MKPTTLLLPASLLALASCGEEAPAADVETQVAASVDEPTITLEPKAPGTDFPDATITKWAYEEGAFDYDYDASTYELGAQSPDAEQTTCANSAKGQHIHLIVDDQPYVAKYEPEFEYEVEDGSHYILTFLSRSYHESIKTDAAHRAELVEVEGGSFTRNAPIEEPMLFYSRPKGTYVGEDAESILLDFYPVNLELGADYKVKVEVADQKAPEDESPANDVLPPAATFVVDAWQPYLLEGLPMGEHTVTLTLIDGEGATVDAPLNPVSRTFTLEADPAAEM